MSAKEAVALQKDLAVRVSRCGHVGMARYVAGVDVSVTPAGGATAAVVVLRYPELAVTEFQAVHGVVGFPYVPGLLSFRELPLVLEAFSRLKTIPDVVMVDGQGIAHPRRLGIAAHLGLFLNVPTIGCAKSWLFGVGELPKETSGSFEELRDGDEVIGVMLRTKEGVKPLYISVGHKLDLKEAIAWVMRCVRGYRLPEPTRLAHLGAAGKLIWKPAGTCSARSD
jgi:deoxyribonuclease V